MKFHLPNATPPSTTEATRPRSTNTWPMLRTPNASSLMIPSFAPSLTPLASLKRGRPGCLALGRSRGGFSAKVLITVDGLGNPLRFILTGSQENDITQAEALLAGYAVECVIADKGYDAQWLRQCIAELGMTPVIPGRSNWKAVVYDPDWYGERHLVDHLIGQAKLYRRVFTWFEKLRRCYLGFWHFAAALIWLR